MRSLPLLRVLRSTAAVGAIALGSSAANAACTTSNGVVTCTGPSTSDDVQSAYNRSAPPSVALVIAEGATVVRGFNSSIAPNGNSFNGGIGYTNIGTVGTQAANVDYNYFGRIDLSGNTLTFDNRGTQNGGIFAFNVGGAITGANSGVVTRGVDLRGAGPIAFTNTARVSNANTFFNDSAITLISSRTTSQTGADGITRITETGGPVTATIGGVVGVPATATAAFRPQSVFTRSVGGVDLTVTGTAGQVSADASGNVSASQFTSVRGTATTTQTQVNDNRTIGGNARVAIGAVGQVTDVNVRSGPGTATAIIDGAVAPGPNFNGSGQVFVSASGGDSTFRQVNVFANNAPFTSERTTTSTNTSNGGAALVDVSTTGRVTGSIGASSNAGSATVRIAGQVGSANSFSSVSADATGSNSTNQDRFVSRADGTFESSNSSTAGLSGGAALATVAATGQVSGNVSATGDGSAAVDNGGRIRGATATSNRTFTTASANASSRTIVTNATGVRTSVDQNDSSFTVQTLGGAATIVNRLGGTIDGFVQANGIRGATLDNAGSITGGVFLTSTGNRRDGANSDRTTTTSAPATGGTTTTVVRDFSSTDVTRVTGGAVTGTYGGTVGVAPPAGSFSQVNQFGDTSSTATVTGTMFADFSGSAGGQNRNFATSGTSRQVTQPSGASTREQSQTTRDVFTQAASTSSLTVASTGRILANASGAGNASVSSAGGNAGFTLDGGRVDGDVDVTAGTGNNRILTSDSASTFTRAASTPNVFVPEVQQSQTDNRRDEVRSAPGVAIVRVNGGSIGGDLTAQGTGTGAGTLAADVTFNGTLTGGLSAFGTGVSSLSTTNDVQTRTGPTTVARTTTTRNSTLPSTTAGGVLGNVGGTVGGGIIIGADIGNATLNLTGRANTLTADGVEVVSFFVPQQNETVQTSTSTGFNGFQVLTGRTTNSVSTLTGGTATFNVAADAAVRTANASSVEGDVFVQGFAGSTLNVAAGSRILQTAGTLNVGAPFTNSTNATTTTFAGGVQTGSTTTSTSTPVGGPALVTNAGIIGSAANAVVVNVASIGGATVNNSGTINGAIAAVSRGVNRTTTTTVTDASNPALRRTVTTSSLTAVGGPVRVDNSGLVTGGVGAMGATGTVTNSGVIRGAVTLGGPASNFTTTTTTTAVPATTTTPAGTSTVISPSVPNAALFTQTYTLNQNGLLIGGVATTGTTTIDPSGATVRTSNVNAAINLNNGSITLGNITGGANTATNVTLNGSGFLGVAANDLTRPLVPGQIVTGYQPTPSLARFAAIDPTLGTSTPLPAGSRVSGVQTLTKTGDGTFVIVGAPLLAGVGGAPATQTQTLDVGTLRVNGGELQLGLAGATATANSFGIRGNVENNAGLVVGRRITDGAQTAIQGINVSVLGNVTNAAAGNLVVGVNPSLVRGNAPAAGGNPFAGTPAPFVAFGANAPGFASTNSFVRVDGNLNLAGTVAVQGLANGLYEEGRAYDLFSVGGTYANTGTVRSNFASPFVGFTLTPRSEGGRTIVSLNVVRTNFDTAATDQNAVAAARALQADLPAIFGGVRNGNDANAQDLANIVSALDTRLTADQAAQLFRELSSGEVYGSLSAVSTTVPFGDATDGLPLAETAPGVGLWFRPTGQFAKYKRDRTTGAAELDVNNYGGSIGLDYNTGGGGHVGIAGGYGKLDVDTEASESAKADTYMVGVYGVQQLGGLNVSAQAVYGKSKWKTMRELTLLSRTATGRFDSNEIRANLRVAYTVAPLPGLDISPFAKVEARRYDFDGFTETGAGAVSLIVDKRRKTVVSPEVGVRMSGVLGSRLRPFAEGSYIFQGDVGSDRNMTFVGAAANGFTTAGVDPGDSIKAAIGVAADIAGGTVFVRGDYASGGQQQVGSVRGGLLFSF